MSSINILFIGDVVGEPGLKMVETWMPGLIKKHKAVYFLTIGGAGAYLAKRIKSYLALNSLKGVETLL